MPNTSYTQTTDMPRDTDPEAAAKVYDLIREVKFVMFGTYDGEGTLHARPMATIEAGEDTDSIWFLTRAGSRKTRELAADPRATLLYSDPGDQTYVSITGRAEVVNDRAKIEDLFSEPMRTWFPDGADDPEMRAVRFRPDAAEYWDNPSAAMVYAYGYLKAKITGKPPKPGDVGIVDL